MAQIIMETSEFESLKAELASNKLENISLNSKIDEIKRSYELQIESLNEKLADAELGKHVTFSDFAIEDYKNHFIGMISKINDTVKTYKSSATVYRSIIAYSSFVNNMLSDLTTMCEGFDNAAKNKEMLTSKKYVGLEEAYEIIKSELLVDEKKKLQMKIDSFEIEKEKFNIERSNIYKAISEEKQQSMDEIKHLSEKARHELNEEKEKFKSYKDIEESKINRSKLAYKEEVKYDYETVISSLENKVSNLSESLTSAKEAEKTVIAERDEFKDKLNSMNRNLKDKDNKIKSLKRDLDLLVDSSNFVKSASR